MRASARCVTWKVVSLAGRRRSKRHCQHIDAVAGRGRWGVPNVTTGYSLREDRIMRISCKVEYGIRALLDLALHGQRGPNLSRDTAQRQGIPETYLNQLLLQLRRSGLVTSVRGPRGGHMLARPAEDIT